MPPINITRGGKTLGQRQKVSMKKRMEITVLQLENKAKTLPGEDKVGSTTHENLLTGYS